MDQINTRLPPFFDAKSLREELTSYWRENPDNTAQLRARVLQRLKELKQSAHRASSRTSRPRLATGAHVLLLCRTFRMRS